jgi:hypothetical protein
MEHTLRFEKLIKGTNTPKPINLIDLNKTLDKENIVLDLEERIITILKLKKISEIHRKALIFYLKKLQAYFKISTDYIRFLLLFDLFQNYKEAVEGSRSRYGRSKVRLVMRKFRFILNKEGIKTYKETRDFKRRRMTALGIDKWRETQVLEFLLL